MQRHSRCDLQFSKLLNNILHNYCAVNTQIGINKCVELFLQNEICNQNSLASRRTAMVACMSTSTTRLYYWGAL